jgi:tRNA pseudouridine38-40 synthase
MVRAICGTLIYASLGKIDPGEIASLLEKGDRRLTGPTLPPEGLYMTRVWYDGAVGQMMD